MKIVFERKPPVIETEAVEIIQFASRLVGIRENASILVRVVPTRYANDPAGARHRAHAYSGVAYYPAYLARLIARRAKGYQAYVGFHYAVDLRIGPPERYPLPARRLMPALKDWREALVFLAAHELEHVLQMVRQETPRETGANVSGRWALATYKAFIGSKQS